MGRDKEQMFEKLKKAIELDPNYKKWARSHKDFQKYWHDPVFGEITKP